MKLLVDFIWFILFLVHTSLTIIRYSFVLLAVLCKCVAVAQAYVKKVMNRANIYSKLGYLDTSGTYVWDGGKYKKIRRVCLETKECPICYEDQMHWTEVKCKHDLCTTCFKRVVLSGQGCPLCRGAIF